MLRLNLSREPEWLELAPGLRLLLAPMSTALMLAARADPAVQDLPEDASNDARGMVFARALARRALLNWEGVGDAEGKPLPITPEGIDALLEIFPVFDAFQTEFVGKGLMLDAEGNASAPSPTGTSAAARATVPPVSAAAPTAPRG
ncbi:hypothetical protein [Phaeovulum sp.]|uniref:hypothetical protein n=1 Tax=Phaeovulum sp. TaxID=2934796 RepID=UPI00272F6C8E|nr:hypothetical protein [Phaeovulum sp.]MDP1669657.1 hypothetical protein [Phaeovulum sp.]MDZ4117849.1 hypothetical protein [Phaeovulum sp.]